MCPNFPCMGLGSQNFGYLEAHDRQLVGLAAQAERYFTDAPNTCLIKLSQLAELLAAEVAARFGLLG